MSCIYKITNLKTGKIYIGQTVKSPEARLQDHWWDAMRFIKRELAGEKNKHDSRLYRALVRYGKDNFIIESIHEILDGEDINELEKYYIQFYDACNPQIGYNIAEGGNKPPSRKNWHPSKETRLRQSQIQTGKHWYTDGKTELMIFKNEQPPEGFYLGRLAGQGFKSGAANPSFGKPGTNSGKSLSIATKQKISETKKAQSQFRRTTWYNNGEVEIQIDLNKTAEIPDGYIKGRLRSNLHPTVIIEVTDLLTNTVTDYAGYSAVTAATGLAFVTINKSINLQAIVKNRYLCRVKLSEKE